MVWTCPNSGFDSLLSSVRRVRCAIVSEISSRSSGASLRSVSKLVCGSEWKRWRDVGEVVLKLLVNGADNGSISVVAIEGAGKSANGLVGARCGNTTKAASICAGENHAEKHHADEGAKHDEARATLKEPARCACHGKERDEPPNADDARDRARKQPAA